MRVITCHIQMFSNDQMIQVIDTNSSEVFYQKTDISELPKVVSALAHQNDIEKIILSGGAYCDPYAEEIKTTYTLNYGVNNNLEVEVF